MPYKPTIRISTHPGQSGGGGGGVGFGLEFEFEFGFTVNVSGSGSLQCVSGQQKNGKREGKIAKIP